MPIRIFDSPEQLFASVGQEVAVSDWFTVDQQHINLFADATEDHQWIHVDPERAKTGPFGTTIAHGFLTMSLIPYFFERSFKANGVRMIINYGLNRVRFPSPVPVNSRVRAHLTLASVTPEKDGSQQLTWDVTIELEGGAKPACIAESLMRFYL
jgi:acyl dehydratase